MPVRSRSELTGERIRAAEEFSLLRPEQVAEAETSFKRIYDEDAHYTPAYSVYDNAPVWVPHDLVSLRGEGGAATSSGLAAGTTRLRALLRAIEELVERDALMITWLHSVQGRQVALTLATPPTSPRSADA